MRNLWSADGMAIIRDIGAVLIAVMVVATLCLIVLFEIVNGKAVQIPVELAAPATLILGFFFGQHATTSGVNGAIASAAAAAAETIKGGTNGATQPPGK